MGKAKPIYIYSYSSDQIFTSPDFEFDAMTTSAPPSPAAAVEVEPAKLTYLYPIPYEEIHCEAAEALMTLKQDLIEGVRLDLSSRHSERFCTSYSAMAGKTVIPSQSSSKVLKTPTANFGFGANYTGSKLMWLGKMTTDGQWDAKFKYDFTHNLAMRVDAQLTGEPRKWHGLIKYDYKGSYYRAQFQRRSGGLLGASYIQSVSPHLSIGGEVFLSAGRKSDFGYAARYNTDKMVATGQVCTNGTIALSYVHKLSKKNCLVSDFMCNYMSKDITASIGYDYYFKTEHRLRGKIDSNGVVAFSLQHADGAFLHSFQFDYVKQDFKFGFQISL